MPYNFIKIKIPYDNEHSPLVMEQILSSLHSMGETFSMEVWNFEGKISLCFWTNQKKLLLQLLETHYPGIFMEEFSDVKNYISRNIYTVHLKLSSCDIYPIRRYSQTTDWIQRTRTNPYLSLLAPFTKMKEIGGIQIIVKPCFWYKKGGETLEVDEYLNTWWIFAHFWKLKTFFLKKVYHHWWLRIFLVTIARGRKKISFVDFNDAIDHRGHSRETSFQAARAKLSQIGFSVTIRLIASKKEDLSAIASGFSQFNIPEFNGFRLGKVSSNSANAIKNRHFYNPFILSLEELAGILVLPTKEVKIPELERTTFRSIRKNSEQQGIVIGKSLHDKLIHISSENFTKHIAIIGRTGSGKSTCALNILCEAFKNGEGGGVLDPHGDFIDTIIQMIPENRINDIVFIDPTDTEFPVALNVLCGQDKNKVISCIISTFKKLYAQSWGARTEYILTNVLSLLAEQPISCLLDVQKILIDGNFRKECLLNTDDPMIQQFWENEFLKIPTKMRNEAIAPILNKVNRFLMIPMIRNILGQTHNLIDFRKCMDEQKIILIKLSKGQMGEENSVLLGNFILSLLEIAALSRSDLDVKDRKSFHIFVDELQHFTKIADDHIATLLSEGRKYGINLIIATQHLAQLGSLEENIFGNVSTLISFGLGHTDAKKLTLYLQEVDVSDLVNLSPYHAYLRTFKDGIADVVSMRNIPIEVPLNEMRKTHITQMSRKKYARIRKDVEHEIRKSLQDSDIPLP